MWAMEMTVAATYQGSPMKEQRAMRVPPRTGPDGSQPPSAEAVGGRKLSREPAPSHLLGGVGETELSQSSHFAEEVLRALLSLLDSTLEGLPP